MSESSDFETELEVVEDELVQPFDHLHHADILSRLEMVRLHFLALRGIGYDELLEQGLFLVITRIEVDYLREIRAGLYKATVEQVEISGKSILLRQRVVNERSKDCVRALVCSKLLDSKLGRAIEPSEELRAKFLNS